MRLPHLHTSHTRDAALRHLQRANRWVLAGSVALTGVLTEAAAHAFPGRSTKHTSASHGTHHKAHAHKPPATSTTPVKPLQAPEQTPQTGGGGESEAQSAPPQQTPSEAPAPSESAPSQESSPAAPEPESQPSEPAAPAPEPSAPVVSGGS